MFENSPEMKRLRRKVGAECLWLFILSFLQDKLEKEFGIVVSRIISYQVLYLLEARGFVSSFTKSVDGRVRKYYKITRRGEKLLEEGKAFLVRTADQL